MSEFYTSNPDDLGRCYTSMNRQEPIEITIRQCGQAQIYKGVVQAVVEDRVHPWKRWLVTMTDTKGVGRLP
jgi:hypothetical protein